MEQEEKQLLLKDLCARLPYGVRVQGNFKWGFDDQIMDDMRESVLDIETLEWLMNGIEVRPYLRPMSSMTEEEKHKLLKFGAITCLKNGEVIDVSCVGFERHADVQDYLNTCHFDYRGLINKGLAIAVTEENNPYKE